MESMFQNDLTLVSQNLLGIKAVLDIANSGSLKEFNPITIHDFLVCINKQILENYQVIENILTVINEQI